MATDSTPPFPPDSSVADLDGSDQGGDEIGEPSAPAMNLTTEQASDAGIVDPKAGDSYTLTVTITGTGEGVTGSIMPGSAKMETPPDEVPPALRKGKQSVKSPDDMGFAGEGFSSTSSNLP